MRHDLWYAMRRLRARPWHAAAVVAIFAVGSGATLTVFRVADAVLLRALPYRGAERIVHVATHVPIAPNRELPYSDVGYRALEHRSRSFEAIASYRVVGVNLTRRDTPLRALSARVTGSFFGVLGIGAQRGRLFMDGEETAKGPPVIVLSDGFWRRAFAADSAVIGTTVRVDGAPATIVGVADARTAYPSPNIDYWTLMDLDANGTAPFELGLDVVARMRPGVSVVAATADASRIVQEVAHENPGPHSTPNSDVSDFRAIMRPLRDDMAGGVKPTLALLTAAVLFVLCLTCVNVATLELIRSSGRRAELAVRSALGADRRQLVFGAVVEGFALAAVGGMVGLALSGITVRVLQSIMPEAFGAGLLGPMTPGIVGATIMTVLICSAASAVFPIAMAMSGDIQSGLRERAGSATRRMTAIRRSLVVVQIAFACILMDGATLMIVTVRQAQRVSLGFRPDGLMIFRLSLPRETYARPADVTSAFRALTDQLSAIPGVTEIGLASNIPLGPDYQETLIGVEGRPFKADGSDPGADVRVVSAGYFAAMGIALASGRVFREGDSYLGGTPVVISQSLAKLLWPNGDDPMGHRLRTGPFAPWMTVTGVGGDVRNRALTAPSRPEMYLPFGAPRSPMGVSRDMSIVLRTSGSVESVQAAAQRIALQANPDLPLYGARAFSDVLAASQRREIATMRTLTGFAAVALILAIAGSYAMLMSVVIQRERELALRQVIGADSTDLLMLVGKEMGQLLLIGLAVGFGGTILLSRLLARFLFGVGALDIGVILMTLAMVAVAGLGAALIPARRAAAVDPMLVLRAD